MKSFDEFINEGFFHKDVNVKKVFELNKNRDIGDKMLNDAGVEVDEIVYIDSKRIITFGQMANGYVLTDVLGFNSTYTTIPIPELAFKKLKEFKG